MVTVDGDMVSAVWGVATTARRCSLLGKGSLTVRVILRTT